MRFVTLFLVFSALVAMNGCSVSQQSVGDVGDQLQSGLQGKGKIVPYHSSTDTFGNDYN